MEPEVIVIDSSDGEDLPDGLLCRSPLAKRPEDMILGMNSTYICHIGKSESWAKREHRALVTRLAPCSAYKLDINAVISTDPVAIQTAPLLPRNSYSSCLYKVLQLLLVEISFSEVAKLYDYFRFHSVPDRSGFSGIPAKVPQWCLSAAHCP